MGERVRGGHNHVVCDSRYWELVEQRQTLSITDVYMIPTGYAIIGATVLLIWAAWREMMGGDPGG